MSEIGCSRKEKITAAKMFIEFHSRDEIAEFIVNLKDAIDGLGYNNNSLLKSYSKVCFERDEWKADAENLAKDNERMANLVGGKEINEWKNIEQYRALVGKYKTKKNNSWDKLSKQVLDENRGAWEELGKEGENDL